MCVFHQENYIKLLELLMKSISLRANINKETTDILILTSPSFQPLIQKKLDGFVLPLHYYILELDTLFDACLSRLNIFNYDNIYKYNTILYLDTDILLNSDINVLFDLEISSDKLYALEEGTIGHKNNFYGANFFDFKKYDRTISAFTSGILLFRNSVCMKSLVNTINTHIKNHINNYREQNPDENNLFKLVFGDQPFIVFNAISQNKYDNQVLKKYIENNPSTVSSEKIIYHFPGYPGQYDSKHLKMEKFWKEIEYTTQYLLTLYTNVRIKPNKNELLSLIGICVSYNYFDTLQFMLPVNYLHFTKLYVVTQEDDKQTIDFCKQFDNVVVLLYKFKTADKTFDKYGALNYVQKIVYEEHPDSWYLIVDSDIILPTNFIDILIYEQLNPECIYGAVRYNLSQSSELLNKSRIIQKNKTWKYNNILWNSSPPSIIGSFQLYKKKDVYHRNDFKDAGTGDYIFGYDNFNLFCNLENMYVLHFGQANKNWSGKTVSFINDGHISLEDIYYSCNITASNIYYDNKCDIVGFSNTKNIYDDIWTCSDEMRIHIANFFKDKSHFKIAEIGAHKGYTTNILSRIFSKVYAVDNSIEWTSFSKNYNLFRTNINYVMLDIYKGKWTILPADIDVVFIDAVHSYEACKSDILNSINRFTNLKYIMFDDYGVWGGVKKVVDEMINNKTLIFEKFIGLKNVPGPNGIVENVNEGMICKVNPHKNTKRLVNRLVKRLVNRRGKCNSPECNFLKHKNPSNNGGTHCCLSCKITQGYHGPLCAKV
jgi:lipopolysaccharide biosynthesis glycosyltransferase